MITFVYGVMSGTGALGLGHYLAAHRTGLTAALAVTCAWLATAIHLPLIAPHEGAHVAPHSLRTPLRVRVWRALAKRKGVPA